MPAAAVSPAPSAGPDGARQRDRAEIVRYNNTAEGIGCSVATMIALARRKLISVGTSFDAIAFPRRALAWITNAGRETLRSR